MEAVKWGIQLNEQQLKEKQALAAKMKLIRWCRTFCKPTVWMKAGLRTTRTGFINGSTS